MKIWRYMDLAKFVDMLAKGTLYFSCLTQLKRDDPYEGWLPDSHFDALARVYQHQLDDLKHNLEAIRATHPTRDHAALDALLEEAQRKFDLRQMLEKVTDKFGASCWHINDGESAAMWKLYTAAGDGIAIESTRPKLESALKGDGIFVDEVQYRDFESDEIEKGHEHYIAYIKRKSFAHEQELRAIIPLPKSGVGTPVLCDVDALITKIYISPQAPPYYADAVRYIVKHADPKITAPVEPSRLLDRPYG